MLVVSGLEKKRVIDIRGRVEKERDMNIYYGLGD